MTAQVRIVRGEYHSKPVSGVFQMTKPLTSGKRGSFITIVNDGTLGDNIAGKPCRINVNSSADFEYLSGASVTVPTG